MADQKSLTVLGLGFAGVTVSVMLLTMVVVQKHIAAASNELTANAMASVASTVLR